MALPPTVPTSFVPRPQTASVRRQSNFSGAFAFVGYGVLAVVVALALGAFLYSEILATEQNSKDSELAKQVAAIDPHTATTFIRLRSRLSESAKLLNQHIALSGFWSVFSAIAPASVRMKTVHVSRDDSGAVTIDATGVAKSFNALAAASDAFAKDGRIKDAIFSSIAVAGNAVTFSLSASVDPSLVAFSPLASSAGAPAAPSAAGAPAALTASSTASSSPVL
ncbi:MAG: hypothetical protein KGI78_02605 [Patescibacteria group bacterium]|nr:hypothetical protein [Patescibacteria group bacterium]MDE1944557.1 hypothetical protein [Patescibacteria group bacterium]MDE1945554.1 hypothetical protein [Patescibacteria group bacterium]MDE2057723.1 hypothetical protein [Patescibacteria group bacterium]